MYKCGNLPAKGLIQKNVFWCTGKPLLCSNHVTYFHKVIINHRSQVVRRKPVRFKKNLVINIFILKNYFSSYLIPKFCTSLSRYCQSNNRVGGLYKTLISALSIIVRKLAIFLLFFF